jgi:hypothetical protein
VCFEVELLESPWLEQTGSALAQRVTKPSLRKEAHDTSA